MIVLWQELMLSFFFITLIMIVWLAWEMTRFVQWWEEMEIDFSMDELKDDLHLQRGDDE